MSEDYGDFLVYDTNEAEPGGRKYNETIGLFWNSLLSANPNKIPPVFGDPSVLLTFGCYNYRDIQSNTAVIRKNYCGVLPGTSITHSVGSADAPINLAQNVPVFVTVLDTITLDQFADERDENGTQVNPLNVLKDENDAVRPDDVELTIQRHDSTEKQIPVLNYRLRSQPFTLTIPKNSELAHRMERPFDLDTIYRNTVAEGFYVLIKFTNPGVYRIQSKGFGERGYRSIADYTFEMP